MPLRPFPTDFLNFVCVCVCVFQSFCEDLCGFLQIFPVFGAGAAGGKALIPILKHHGNENHTQLPRNLALIVWGKSCKGKYNTKIAWGRWESKSQCCNLLSHLESASLRRLESPLRRPQSEEGEQNVPPQLSLPPPKCVAAKCSPTSGRPGGGRAFAARYLLLPFGLSTESHDSVIAGPESPECLEQEAQNRS